jgi:hypothetical protein
LSIYRKFLLVSIGFIILVSIGFLVFTSVPLHKYGQQDDLTANLAAHGNWITREVPAQNITQFISTIQFNMPHSRRVWLYAELQADKVTSIPDDKILKIELCDDPSFDMSQKDIHVSYENLCNSAIVSVERKLPGHNPQVTLRISHDIPANIYVDKLLIKPLPGLYQRAILFQSWCRVYFIKILVLFWAFILITVCSTLLLKYCYSKIKNRLLLLLTIPYVIVFSLIAAFPYWCSWDTEFDFSAEYKEPLCIPADPAGGVSAVIISNIQFSVSHPEYIAFEFNYPDRSQDLANSYVRADIVNEKKKSIDIFDRIYRFDNNKNRLCTEFGIIPPNKKKGAYSNLYLRIRHKCNKDIYVNNISIKRLWISYPASKLFKLLCSERFLTLSILTLTWIFASVIVILIDRNYHLQSGLILFIIGIILFYCPLSFNDGCDVIDDTSLSEGKTLLKSRYTYSYPVRIESYSLYLLSLDACLAGKPPEDRRIWKVDLYSRHMDDDSHEMQIPYCHMSEGRYSREGLIIYSAHFNAGSLRFFGKWGDGVYVKNVKLVKLSVPLVILHKSWWVFIALGIFFLLIGLRIIFRQICVWFVRLQHRFKFHSAIILFSIIIFYSLCALCFIGYTCYAQNRIVTSSHIYFYCAAPIIIILFLLYVGWPLATLIATHAFQQKYELLVAPLLGLIILAVMHTLSLVGIPLYIGLILLASVITPAWIILLITKRYPVLPDIRGCIVICAGILMFFFCLSPLTTQHDITSFTINNGDLYIYTTETQWLLENTMADATAGTAEFQKPYISYLKATLARVGPQQGTKVIMAVFCIITGLSPFSIHPLTGSILIFLLITGSIAVCRICSIIRNSQLLLFTFFLSLNFIIYQLLWDSFYNNIFGITLLLPVSLFIIYSIYSGNWRFAVPGGIGCAALLSCYPYFIPVIGLICSVFCLYICIIWLFQRKWINYLKLMRSGLIIIAFTFICAPQKSIDFTREICTPESRMRRIRKSRSGGKYYPLKSIHLLSGCSGNSAGVSNMNLLVHLRVYKTVQMIFLPLGLIAIGYFTVKRRKTFPGIYVGTGMVSFSILVAWAFIFVPNKYLYYKSMGYIIPFMSLGYSAGLTELYKDLKKNSLRAFLLFLVFLWIVWRLHALIALARNSSGFRFISEKIFALDEVYDIVKENEIIRINYGDTYTAPHVITVLRKRTLDVPFLFGYITEPHRQKTWDYLLHNEPVNNKKLVWHNNKYFLYRR